VQIGEEDLALAQPRDFFGLGLFHAKDHFRVGEDRVGVRRDPRALLDVGLVRQCASGAGAGLDDHLMTAIDQLAHAHRRQRDPVLIGLDLCRDSDFHWLTSFTG
jgi:hypothetical protein